jgi:4-hydroxybenzoate polyprenyltransferase
MNLAKLNQRLPHYLALMRVDRPIGWILLMWPTLWALWSASDGMPEGVILWVFIAGVWLMRSAGCVINDYVDRDIDPKVERTQSRPIAAGEVAPKEALFLFAGLCLCAASLLLFLPSRVLPWALGAVIITVCYPFMKRYIQAPQLVLGLAFSFGMPMAYVALGKDFDVELLILMLANVCWILIYDTQYAMSDREDDLKIGVNSTAILFAENDKRVIAVLQTSVVLLFALLALLNSYSPSFFIGLVLVGGLFVYQQWLIKDRDRQQCFQAFLNNAWVGACLLLALISA